MKRVAQVIGIPREHWEAYERYHASVWPSVLANIARCNITNYSIFRYGETLFSYYEYVGDDFAADMAKLAEDPETQRWWAVQEPLQKPFDGREEGDWWTTIPEVFHAE